MSVKVDYERVLGHQLVTWIVCFGCIVGLAVAGWLVPHVWMPLVGVGLIMCVSFFENSNKDKAGCHCSMMCDYTVFSLLFSIIVMLAINLLNTRWVDSSILGEGNPEIPFISTMVVFTCAPLTYGVALLRRVKTMRCDACRHNAGYTMREVMEHNLFYGEAKALLKLAFYLSLGLGVLTWLYYWFYYINININSPDVFAFFLVPTAAYVLSIFFLGQKYSSIKFEIKMNGKNSKPEFSTMLRFIVLREDRVLLEMVSVEDEKFGLWDTPAVIEMPYTDYVDDDKALEMLKKHTGNIDMKLRRLFSTSNRSHNVFHFVVVLDNDSEAESEIIKTNSFLRGEWFNIYEIDSMQRSGIVSRPFAYEIHRIYTMTMAWKTYDQNGKRLYPIKNYKPTFRLSDFLDWNIDYSDLRWMRIAQNNEDKPFFKLKKFWRRHVTRVEE